MQIIHSADIQVKSREKNLYKSTQKTLQNIESRIELSKAEIYIMAGDLFEYATPTDQERKLMYNHISKLLNISSLKEIVIMAGNHDLLKEKKESEHTIGNNPINVFIDLLANLDKEKSKKIIYINQSKTYDSKVSNLFRYVGYSLEDNEQFQEEIPLDNKFNICLHHGMLKEYVDSAKLPLRKDVYDSLRSIETFPPNSLICAGDIHADLKFEGLDGQLYIYPGSPLQHTHHEGSTLKIGDHVQLQRYGEIKSIKCYYFDEKIPELKLQDIQISDLQLETNVSYYTLELDNKCNIETIKNAIKNELEIVSHAQTFIKIKSATVFVKHEQDLYKIISELFTSQNMKKYEIVFEYDKLIQSANTISNKAIQEILVEKTEELNANLVKVEGEEGSTENDSKTLSELIHTTNIDDLVLSDNQLNKLFKSVLDSALKSVDDSDITNSELSDDIRAIFAEQMQNLKGSSKRYDIRLLSLETNGFMALGANKILLDIPGIIRIFGTNGIGKTTMYSMLRWVVKGEAFVGMKKSNVMRNNLVVFNKSNINCDTVEVIHHMTINELPVKLTRTATRKWKNNTTDEQKLSLGWKSFISTVDRTFEIAVTKKDGEIQTLVGENAEKSILVWFGDSLDNILFMNQAKLEKFLQMPSDELNEMVLNFVGVDYLNKLETNLDEVKADLLNVPKPTKSKDDLQMQLTDYDIFIRNSEKELLQSESDIIAFEQSIEAEKLTKDSLNKDLQLYGDVPKQIETTTKSIADTKQWLDNFEVKFVKPKVEFMEVKPVLNQAKIDELTLEIKANEAEVGVFQAEIIELEADKKKLIETDLAQHYAKLVNDEKVLHAGYAEDIETKKKELSEEFKKLEDKFTDTVTKLTEKKTAKEKEYTEISLQINTDKEKIKKNKTSIESGYCSECKKPLKDDFESHKVLLEEEIYVLERNIENNQKTQIEIEPTIKKIKDFIVTYSSYRDLCIKQSPTICDLALLKKDHQESFDTIISINGFVDVCYDKIEAINKRLEKLKLIEKIQYNDYSICDEIKVDSTLQAIIYTHKTYRFNASNAKIEIEAIDGKIDAKQVIIDMLKEDHQTASDTYQTKFEANVKLNDKIVEENKLIDDHNNSRIVKQSEHDRLALELNQLNETLQHYLICVEKFNTISELYEGLLADKESLLRKISDIKLKLERNKNDKLVVEQQYASYLKYQKNNLIWKIYSKLVKTNFKEIVFEYYRLFLNSTLNTLLEDVPFKLFWNDDSELYHVELKNGVCTHQPVQQSSGMETCYLALALVYTIHLLNVKNSISHIMIDEISGTLNDGSNLSYDAKNYKELLVLILNKFVDKSVFIIDHSIDNLYETVAYEVQPHVNGSVFKQM